MRNYILPAFVISFFLSACEARSEKKEATGPEINTINNLNSIKMDTATFGAGCFWCTEAIFQDVKGVISVASGYSGGKVKNPSYKEVCMGITGHAEAIQLVYDPKVISYDE